jgi:hypothetical protein
LGDFSVTSPVADSKEQQLDYIALIELHSSAPTLARSCVFEICETAEAASVSLKREQSVTEGHALLIVEIQAANSVTKPIQNARRCCREIAIHCAK